MRISDCSSDVCSSDLLLRGTSKCNSTSWLVVPRNLKDFIEGFNEYASVWNAPPLSVKAPGVWSVSTAVFRQVAMQLKLGCASCRERVWQLGVALGGRGVIKTKKKNDT